MNSPFLTVLRKCGSVCPLDAFKVENVVICRVVYVEPFLKARKALSYLCKSAMIVTSPGKPNGKLLPSALPCVKGNKL